MNLRKFFPLIVLIAVLELFAGGQPGAAAPAILAKAHKASAAATEQSPAPADSAKPADLDAQLAGLQKNITEVQGLLAAVRSDMTTSALAIFGATAAEYEQRSQMARSLNYEYERHTELLRRLKKLRADAKTETTGEAAQLSAFLKQAPFPIDVTDELRGQIQDVRVQIGSISMRRTINANEIERATSDLKAAGVTIRQLQEKIESVKGKIEENRVRWQLDQAQIAERLARARLDACQTSRMIQEEDLASQQGNLEFLERKLAAAVANTPFPRKELDAKLDKLRDSQHALQGELDKAAATRETAARKLDEARTALAAPHDSKAIPALQATADLRKDESDTAAAVYSTLRAMSYLQDYEENAWEVRHRDGNPNQPEQYAEIQKWLAEGAEKTGQAKSYFQTNLDLASSQIAALQTRLENWKPEDGDIKTARQRLATLQTRAERFRRGQDQARRSERLLQSWRAEVQDRLDHVTFGERARGIARQAAGLIDTLWSFELFRVESGVAGRPDRSVTTGKLIGALLILVIGAWLSHRAAETTSRLARVRLRARDNHLRLIQKFIFWSGLFFVILATFTALKIPLTIFAFLGGALAIGIGFGAQNLINNFISGLILMFERPIRVGDIVEVEGLRGKVVTVGGRCSRIKRFDGIDILVPNSSFLEKNVVNWTLSDLLLRLTLKVGVAYGSPTRDVARLIGRAVEEHHHILKDPAPVVVFEDFGDNALVFTAYFWVEQKDGIDSRVVSSDVRYRIEELFREAEISMAFPQRDIHLDTVRPLHVTLVDGAKDRD